MKKGAFGIIRTVIMFTLFTALFISFITSKTRKDTQLSVGDLLERAEGGISGSLVYSPHLEMTADTYVCGGRDCEHVLLIGEEVLQTGRLYVVDVAPCEPSPQICVNITRGGTHG